MFHNRLFNLLSLLFIVSLVLTACGTKVAETPKATEAPKVTETPKVVNLSMTIWGSLLDPEVYQKRLNLFMAKNPNIKVELVYVPSDYDQKVQTMIAGGTAPDIMQMAEGIHGYSDKGQIIPLNDYVKKYNVDLKARYGTDTGGLVGAYSYQGKLYAMPDRGGALVLYYNKNMFDKAGIAYPTKDWTWTEFLDAAQKLTVRNGDKVEVFGFAAGGWWPWWMSFIYMNGGVVLDASGKPVVNSSEAVEAMQFYNDLVWKYKVAPSPEDYANLGQSGPDPLFAQGKAAMSMTGFWGVGGLKDTQINWDIAPLFKQKKNATVIFGSGLAITKDCKYPEEAFKVIEFLTSKDGQMPIVEMVEDAPANFELLNSDAFLKADWASGKQINIKALTESAEIAFPLPLSPKWNEMNKVFDDNLSEFWMNKVDAKTVMDNIQQQLEELFK